MGRRYEGSLSQFIDLHAGPKADASIEELSALAAKLDTPWSIDQIMRARTAKRYRLKADSKLGPRVKGPGAQADAAAAPPKKIGGPPKAERARRKAAQENEIDKAIAREAVLAKRAATTMAKPPRFTQLAERKAAILASEVIEDDGPPPKHTALRKLILDIGLDAAVMIFEEFQTIS